MSDLPPGYTIQPRQSAALPEGYTIQPRQPTGALAERLPFKPGMTAGQMMAPALNRLRTGAPMSLDIAGSAGMKPAIQQSAETSAQQPYRPGMTAGQMIAGRPGALSDPALYAMGPGNIGGLVRPTAPAIMPNQAAIQARVSSIVPPVAPAKPTSIGQAIGMNDPAYVNDALTAQTYRGAIRPARPGLPGAVGIQQQDQAAVTVVDRMIDNKSNLKLTDNYGNTVTNQNPSNVRQFAEGIDNMKKLLFRQWNRMAKDAGIQGITVDTTPVIQALHDAAQRIGTLKPGRARSLTERARTLSLKGPMDPEEAQDYIHLLNMDLGKYYRTHNDQMGELLAPAAKAMRNALDTAVTSAQGPGYQYLRNQYQAFKAVERDVGNAVAKQGNVPESLIGQFADLWSTAELIHGVFNPEAMGRAIGIKAARTIFNAVHNPNRAINRMFQQREASRSAPTPISPISPLPALAPPMQYYQSPQKTDREIRPSVAY